MISFKCHHGKYGIRAMRPSKEDSFKQPKEPQEPQGAINHVGVNGSLRGIASRSLAQKHVMFHGTCYLCKYSSHSQMFCPLRWCRACKMFGHSEAVCARIAGDASELVDASVEDELAEWD